MSIRHTRSHYFVDGVLKVAPIGHPASIRHTELHYFVGGVPKVAPIGHPMSIRHPEPHRGSGAFRRYGAGVARPMCGGAGRMR